MATKKVATPPALSNLDKAMRDAIQAAPLPEQLQFHQINELVRARRHEDFSLELVVGLHSTLTIRLTPEQAVHLSHIIGGCS